MQLVEQAKDVKVSEVEFNPDFISRMVAKVDWPALCKAAEDVGKVLSKVLQIFRQG